MNGWLLTSTLLLGSACAQAARPLDTQDPRFPLRTRVTTAQVRAVEAALPGGLADVNLKVLAAQRPLLTPLARAGDPLAQFLLARTFDLFEYGRGTPQDARTAMEWYTRAAAQHFAPAEQFLSQVYTYRLLGQPVNLTWAGNYLRRAYEHGNADIKADALLEMARQSSPDRDEPRSPGFTASRDRTRAYLLERLKLRPADTTALDWLTGLAEEDRDYGQAVAYAERSDNVMTWLRAARWLQLGQAGLPADPQRALALYRRSVKVLARDEESADLADLRDHLFEMECRGQLQRAQFADLVTPDSERHYLTFRQGCAVVPGG